MLKQLYKYFDLYDIISLLIVLSLMMMTNTHNIIFFYITICGCLIFANKPKVVIPAYFVASLSTSYFALGPGLSAGRFLSLLVIASLILEVMRNRETKLNTKYLPITLFLIIFSFFSTAFGADGGLEVFFLMLQNLIIMFLVQQTTNLNVEKLIVCICISFIIVIGFVFFEAVNNTAMLMFDQRYRGEDDGLNANRIAMMIVQCGALSIAMFMYSKNYLLKSAAVLALLASLFVVFATGSRTALIALMTSSAMAIIFLGKIFSRRGVISVLVIFFIGYFALDFLFSQSSALTDRFSVSAVIDTGGSGRAENAEVIMKKVFPEHIWFGSGMGGANMKALSGQYHFWNLCHNIVFDPLSQLGIIGFSVYLLFLIPFFKNVKVALKSKVSLIIVPIIVLFAAIFNGLGETIFYEKFFWNDISLCMMCYNMYINGFLENTTYGEI